MKQGDWIVYTYRDSNGTSRSLTGTVIEAGSQSVTFKSDGGQPGYPRGRQEIVDIADVRLSDSPFAPKQ